MQMYDVGTTNYSIYYLNCIIKIFNGIYNNEIKWHNNFLFYNTVINLILPHLRPYHQRLLDNAICRIHPFSNKSEEFNKIGQPNDHLHFKKMTQLGLEVEVEPGKKKTGIDDF